MVDATPQNVIKHRFEVIPDNEAGGYVIAFPNLQGCVTQVEDLSEVAAMATDAYRGWVRVCEEQGIPVPPGECAV